MLIGKGANIENKDNDGRTSLMLGIKLKFYVFISNKYDFKLKHQLMVTLVWLTFNQKADKNVNIEHIVSAISYNKEKFEVYLNVFDKIS